MSEDLELRARLTEIIQEGLVSGMGNPVPGELCVEAAICLALGEEHNDFPSCVAAIDRNVAIKLNDLPWPSKQERAKALLPIALAQLDTFSRPRDVWERDVQDGIVRRLLPFILQTMARYHDDCTNLSEAFTEAATYCRGGHAYRAYRRVLQTYRDRLSDHQLRARTMAHDACNEDYSQDTFGVYVRNAIVNLKEADCTEAMRLAAEIVLDAYRREGRAPAKETVSEAPKSSMSTDNPTPSEAPISYTCPSCEEGQVTRMTGSPGHWMVPHGVKRPLPQDLAIDTCDRCHAIFVNEDEGNEIEARVGADYAKERGPAMRAWVEGSGHSHSMLAQVCGVHPTYLTKVLSGNLPPGTALERLLFVATHDPEWFECLHSWSAECPAAPATTEVHDFPKLVVEGNEMEEKHSGFRFDEVRILRVPRQVICSDHPLYVETCLASETPAEVDLMLSDQDGSYLLLSTEDATNLRDFLDAYLSQVIK